MVNSELNKKITKFILSKPYVLVTEIENKFDVSSDMIFDYVESVQEQLEEIGLDIEILEVNKNDYCLIYQKDQDQSLTETQLGLLVIVAFICKKRGGYLSPEIKDEVYGYFSDQFNFLEYENFIEKNESGFWTISPLGILTVFPILNETESLINALFDDLK